MWDPYALEQQVRLRQADELRRAERTRLARLAVQGARAARPRPAIYRRLLYRLGALLVAWGSHLQAYAERPELERQLALQVAHPSDGRTASPAAPPRPFGGHGGVPAVFLRPDGPFGAPADSPSRAPEPTS
jgi:hypothetical protein